MESIAFGVSGAWITFGMADTANSLHSDNGCLDAPEVLCCGSMQSVSIADSGAFAAPTIVAR